MAKLSRSDKKKREEFVRSYSRYYPLIYKTVHDKIGSSDEAEDICQEIFIIFFEKMGSIEDSRKWLYGTMRNVVLRHLSKKSGREVDTEEVFHDKNLLFENGQRDMRIIIEESIEEAGLTGEERLLFDYIAICGYSYSNTGKIMGLTKRQTGYKYNSIIEKKMLVLKVKGIENIEDLL